MRNVLVFLLICFVEIVYCRDFYFGMFERNDFLVAADELYKPRMPGRITYAKYGKLFKCPITYFRVVDRLGSNANPRVEIIRGGIMKKFIVVRLSVYNRPISVNIYVGCHNKNNKHVTYKRRTTKKPTTAATEKEVMQTETETNENDIETINEDDDKDKDKEDNVVTTVESIIETTTIKDNVETTVETETDTDTTKHISLKKNVEIDSGEKSPKESNKGGKKVKTDSVPEEESGSKEQPPAEEEAEAEEEKEEENEDPPKNKKKSKDTHDNWDR
ncbi:myb-like protein X isoform X1 [Plodia interpunctella]|uniref:myb-like protein X isoform X1 n=1 Tax=Plodia interpunctella TaxID=58824 RepID=UPI0023683EB9|nr:myb-like protein X isoform X1 [Plodia interpunctella]